MIRLARCSLLVVIAVLSLGFFGPAAAAAETADTEKTFARYLRLIRDKQYEEAWNLVVTARRAGDRWAIGQFDKWFNKDTPPEMARLSEDWLNTAARQGDVQAQTGLALRILQSEKAETHLAEAVRWLNMAADKGHRDAIFILGQMSRRALESRGIRSKYAGQP